jgi:hypothetical protein
MIKLIDFVFAVISLIVIVSLGFAVNETLNEFSSIIGQEISIDLLIDVIQNGTREEAISFIAIVGSLLFMVFGFPVTIFLVSINGLKK